MCILGLHLSTAEEARSGAPPFVFLFSRDEAAARPTGRFEVDADGVLCGKDAASGGTWLALNTRTGSFACLVDVDELAPAPAMPHGMPPMSRGQLVYQLAKTGALPCAVAGAPFFGLTCVWGNLFDIARGGEAKLCAFCNRPAPESLVERAFSARATPGAHAISNAYLDEASCYAWPKVRDMRAGMAAAVRGAAAASRDERVSFDAAALESAVSRLLLHEGPYPPEALPPLGAFKPGLYADARHLGRCQTILVDYDPADGSVTVLGAAPPAPRPSLASAAAPHIRGFAPHGLAPPSPWRTRAQTLIYAAPGGAAVSVRHRNMDGYMDMRRQCQGGSLPPPPAWEAFEFPVAAPGS
jgi:uncharacterized protein with NRDE domain